MIDVGGPAMLRAAAKNFSFVTPLSRPGGLRRRAPRAPRSRGETTLDTRCRLAGVAFATTAAYDAAIAGWFQQNDEFPETIALAFDKALDLAYGENPHRRAAYYAERGPGTPPLARRAAARNAAVVQQPERPLGGPSPGPRVRRARLRHRQAREPVRSRRRRDPSRRPTRALAADPVSAYGGVVVLNRVLAGTLGDDVPRSSSGVLFAPGYDEPALDALARKASVRILSETERRAPTEAELDYRRGSGGLLVQDGDQEIAARDGMEVVCGEVSEAQWDDLLFAWRVAKHVTSNAIVLARGGQTIGIGAGQMSRVDAVRIALEKARALGHELDEAVLASDAFFPFADGRSSRSTRASLRSSSRADRSVTPR